MKLKSQNPHIALSTMQKMSKSDILSLIHSEDILKAGMALRKDTLIDFLNWELNETKIDMVDIPVNYKEVGK